MNKNNIESIYSNRQSFVDLKEMQKSKKKKNSIRSLFGRNNSPSISASPSTSTLLLDETPDSSVPVSPMTQLDPFESLSEQPVSTYYKKLSYSSATLQAVAVDTLECNAHGSLFTAFSKNSTLERRTFVLLPRAILRYPVNSTSQTSPEQVLMLSAESVAYASDDIPDHEYVLRVSEHPEPHQLDDSISPVTSHEDSGAASTTSSRRSSMFFHHPNISSPSFHHHSKDPLSSTRHSHHLPLRRDHDKAKTLLLVFGTANEFMRWMGLVRSQVKLRRESDEVRIGTDDPDDPLESSQFSTDSHALSDRITRPLSSTTLSAMALSSKRPSVASITSNSANSLRRPATLPIPRNLSTVSVETSSSSELDSFSKSPHMVTATSHPTHAQRLQSRQSLQQSLSTFAIRPLPARRESMTLSRPPPPPTAETEDSDPDPIDSVAQSLRAVRLKQRRKHARSSIGPPPNRPLPPVPMTPISPMSDDVKA
ncbi:hypothetical protein V1512DRAFT_259288 [Lipomyces arxii]|uniref:uncharacterized protein n=1 Tax=Lipomyces arxii TaxID=56418 RepID=UPI0034CD742E